MTTLEERLDELLALSAEVGSLSAKLAATEHDRAWGSKSDRPFNARNARDLRKKLAAAEKVLAAARASFLQG